MFYEWFMGSGREDDSIAGGGRAVFIQDVHFWGVEFVGEGLSNPNHYSQCTTYFIFAEITKLYNFNFCLLQMINLQL